MSTRPLGGTQKALLKRMSGAFSENGYRSFYPGGGWVWDTHSNTVRILESLTKRGLVKKTPRGAGKYRYDITDAGCEAVKDG